MGVLVDKLSGKASMAYGLIHDMIKLRGDKTRGEAWECMRCGKIEVVGPRCSFWYHSYTDGFARIPGYDSPPACVWHDQIVDGKSVLF